MPTKVHPVKAMVFLVVMYGCESWDYKESWAPKNWCFWSVVLKTLESPLDFKEIQQSTLKDRIFIGRTDAVAETPILWQSGAKNRLIGKDPDSGNDWGQEDKGMTEDEIVGWYHWLDGHEFEQAPGVVMNRGAWCAAVHGVTKGQTRPSNWTELIVARGSSVLLVFSNN